MPVAQKGRPGTGPGLEVLFGCGAAGRQEGREPDIGLGRIAGIGTALAAIATLAIAAGPAARTAVAVAAAFAVAFILLRLGRLAVAIALDRYRLDDDGLAIVGIRHRRLRLLLLIRLRLLLERLARFRAGEAIIDRREIVVEILALGLRRELVAICGWAAATMRK